MPHANNAKYKKQSPRIWERVSSKATTSQQLRSPDAAAMRARIPPKNGRIIGEGYHQEFGGPHAEVLALRNAFEDPIGATAYITLEPCSIYGKTPPCTVALIDAGIKMLEAKGAKPGQIFYDKFT